MQYDDVAVGDEMDDADGDLAAELNSVNPNENMDIPIDDEIRDILFNKNRKYGIKNLKDSTQEKLYNYLVKRSCAVLRARGQSHEMLEKDFLARRMQDPSESL
jgi:hypothetical protein